MKQLFITILKVFITNIRALYLAGCGKKPTTNTLQARENLGDE
jgi:hypothetical protein